MLDEAEVSLLKNTKHNTIFFKKRSRTGVAYIGVGNYCLI